MWEGGGEGKLPWAGVRGKLPRLTQGGGAGAKLPRGGGRKINCYTGTLYR